MGNPQYECTLSPLAKKVAKEELREDDEIRSFALQQMRNWIAKHPRIVSCRIGNQFESIL